MNRNCVKQIREKKPVVHCITNIVTVNDCANILLAVGASPIMAHHPLEVAEITAAASALVCNMGALEDYEAMLIAGEAASKLKHPIVVDPVGVAGSTYRRQQCLKLMETCSISCIRGNYSEIRALMENQNTGAGVDNTDNPKKDDIETFSEAVKKFALEKNTIVVASGKTDIVTDGRRLVLVDRGHEMMGRITGSGCMATCLIGAFLSVADDSFEAVVTACQLLGECGERAANKIIEKGGGTMSFRLSFIDELSLIDYVG